MVKIIKRALMVVIIFTLISSSLLFLSENGFSENNSTPSTWPQTPGTVVLGKNWNSNKANPVKVGFVENDAYESGWATEPYEFKTSIWNNKDNQRVTVDVWIQDGALLSSMGVYYYRWQDKNGYNFEPGYYSTGEIGKEIQAKMFQEYDWVTNTNKTKNADTGWIYPTMAEVVNRTFHARFTFLTTAGNFTNGLFKISIIVHVHWTFIFWQRDRWESLADIYGVFTWGSIRYNPPSQDVTDKGYTHISGTVQGGNWRIELWYAGDNGTWNTTNVGVTNKEGTAKLIKDFGYFNVSKNPIFDLTYNFSTTDPSGVYLWLFYSVYTTGEILNYFSVVIHNNAKDLATEGNPPTVTISFTGSKEINGDLTVIINVSGTNGTATMVWLIGYYGAQLNHIPAVTDAIIMPLYNYPIEFTSDGSKQIKVRMNMGGQFNVIAQVKRIGQHVMSQGMNYVIIQGFQGGGGDLGGDTKPSWFMFPWQSTANMAILFVGVLLIFSRRPRLTLIGMLLFFAAFVNWTYVGAMIKAGLNPLNWFHMGVLR